MKNIKLYSSNMHEQDWAELCISLDIELGTNVIDIKVSSFSTEMDVYCSICDTAYINTKENVPDLHYCCDQCRDNRSDMDIPPNNFSKKLVIDYFI